MTTPGNFSEANASSLVMGEWNNTTITCVSNSNCGQSMGNTYGTPQMRRLHDGRWAMIFGNGFGSVTGDAGIFVMTLDPTNGASGAQIYYLSTGINNPRTGSPNGIAFTTPADLDGDHVADYFYAGDLQGNVWRFDLTDPNEANWMVSPGPLFKTGGLPITTQVVVASGSSSPGQQQQIMVLFGTGSKTPIKADARDGPQEPVRGGTGTGASDGGRLGPGANPPGWDGVPRAVRGPDPGQCGRTTLRRRTCGSRSSRSMPRQNRDISERDHLLDRRLPGECAPVRLVPESARLTRQIIFSPSSSRRRNPSIDRPASTRPPRARTTVTPASRALPAMTGGAFNTVFLPPSEAANPAVAAQAAYQDVHAIAMQTNATGSSFITGNSAGTQYLVFETNQVEGGTGANGNNILGGTLGLNLPPNTTGKRLSWIELR